MLANLLLKESHVQTGYLSRQRLYEDVYKMCISMYMWN